MNSNAATAGLVLAGIPSPHALDRVRRYCGLPWSGGPPETWAFRYFDAIETDGDRLEPTDVVSAAALHPGVSRSDLTFFHDRRAAIESWLNGIPTDRSLADSDDVGALRELIDFGAPSFTLLTKVLHHKRPRFVPIVDRHVLDRYRPITGERQAFRAWPMLIEALREDLRTNDAPIAEIADTIKLESGHDISALRVCDVVIWMDTRS